MLRNPAIYLQGLGVAAAAALCTWALSLYRRNVATVDSLWSLMFMLMAYTYALHPRAVGPRAALVLILATAWALLRLSIYIT